MNTEEPIAETRRPHPHRKLATNTANVGKRSSARQIPGKNKDFGRNTAQREQLFCNFCFFNRSKCNIFSPFAFSEYKASK